MFYFIPSRRVLGNLWKTLIRPASHLPSPLFTYSNLNHNLLLRPLSSPFSHSPLFANRNKKKKKRESPRTKLVQHESRRVNHFEELVQRDSLFRFITRTKDFLCKQPEHILQLDEAGKLYRELGFPRGRKVTRSILQHPLLLQPYRHTDGKMWFGFTDLMEDLLEEEKAIMDATEQTRILRIRKLLMMSAKKRIPLSKLYHCRHLFGVPEDFRDQIGKYSEYFKVVFEEDGKRVLELVEWEPALAISALERDFVVEEDRVRKMFKFPIRKGKSLDLDADDEIKMNSLNTLPLVSPYSDGSNLDIWSLEAEKYRVGILHEFLSLTLEKKASIHHIVEFKEEFSLTKHTYHMLMKQPKAFYLAGTEMNWTVFLREGYDHKGELIEKDPLVIFKEKLYQYAQMKEMESKLDFPDNYVRA